MVSANGRSSWLASNRSGSEGKGLGDVAGDAHLAAHLQGGRLVLSRTLTNN